MQLSDDVQPAYSKACERNKDPILAVIRQHFPEMGRVLEVGGGTGQHAVYFSRALPLLRWFPTDTGDYLAPLRARLALEAPSNLAGVVELDVRKSPWLLGQYDAIFSANTLHFMSQACVRALFRGVDESLSDDGVLIIYGPFRYGTEYTSPSNAHFDEWLKQSDPERGIRDFEWVNGLAAAAGLQLLADVAMPANNQALVWHKSINS